GGRPGALRPCPVDYGAALACADAVGQRSLIPPHEQACTFRAESDGPHRERARTVMALYQNDLAHIQATVFGEFAARAATAILPRLRDAPVPVRTVVDIGCGAGVSTRALTDAGFDVLAIEPSPALLEIARTCAPAARFRHASAYEIEMPRCEAILAIG